MTEPLSHARLAEIRALPGVVETAVHDLLVEVDRLRVRVRDLEAATMRRFQVGHKQVAASCRAQPGEWIAAAVYGDNRSARQIASQVRHARGLSAYAPAGAFEARAAGSLLYVRYTGAPPVEGVSGETSQST